MTEIPPHQLVDDVTADLFASAMLDRSRKTPPAEEPTGPSHQINEPCGTGSTSVVSDRADGGRHGRL